MSDEHFLARWSRRKLAAKSASKTEPGQAVSEAALSAESRLASTVVAADPLAIAPGAAPDPAPAPLPPVESLTPESDFAPFMQEHVEESLKRQALKTLFQDPRFNVMDGLDVYIDDYSKPDPLPAGWLEKMNQMARLGDCGTPATEAAEEAAAHEAGPVEPACAESGKTPPEAGAIGGDSPVRSDTSEPQPPRAPLPQSPDQI